MAKANKSANKKEAVESEAAVTGTHEAKQEFSDYAGTDHKRYKVGEDVSHLPEKKLQTFIEAGLVKKTVTEQAKDNEDKAAAKAANKE